MRPCQFPMTRHADGSVTLPPEFLKELGFPVGDTLHMLTTTEGSLIGPRKFIKWKADRDTRLAMFARSTKHRVEAINDIYTALKNRRTYLDK